MENGGAAAKSGGQGAASSWDIWELGNWSSAAIAAGPSSSTSYNPHAIASSSSSPCPPFADHAAAVPTAPGDHRVQGHQYGLHHHLTCLKLGKRPYYGEEGLGGGGIKRERPSPNPAAAVPRCQVEGCNKALVDAKDYHKRHKVCEMHSKAPKVVVLGAEQRFCQQCSRFHVISEFDDSKRSCRRRLAGHNERRRKSTNDSIRNSSLENTMVGIRFPYIPTSPGRALSLLSSKASPWVSTSELSSRSSAALRELIAENRAAVLARQLFSSDRGGWHSMSSGNLANLSYVQHQHQVPSQPQAQLADGWNQFQEAGNHVTLDLMQVPGSSFENILPGRRKSKEEEEECCEIWKSLEGTHVV